MFDLDTKLRSIRSKGTQVGIDATCIQTKAAKRWLGLPTGSGIAVLVDSTTQTILFDGRYEEECAKYRDTFKLIRLKSQSKSARWDALVELAKTKRYRAIGFESPTLSAELYMHLQHIGLSVAPINYMPELRMIKTTEELERLEKACRITDQVFNEVCDKLRIGMTEFEINALIQYYALLHGAEKMSFDPIVSSGPRTALPHGRPTGRKIAAGEPIMIDFGIQIYGMQSDMTRNVVLGKKPNTDYIHHYQQLLRAQELGISLMIEGSDTEAIDGKVREELAQSNLDCYFTHGLGHGVGIDCEDELPLLRPGSSYILQNHMVMSCEPGIYLPGKYGIRIEDDVAIINGVGQALNKTSKALLILEG